MNGRTMRRGEATVVDFWAPLRRSTQARIGLGHSGDGMPTGERLALREALA